VPRLEIGPISQLFQQIFASYGFSKEDSKVISDSLIDADLRGIQSHGIQRLKMYHQRIKNGDIVVDQAPEVLVDLPAISVINAHHGMGQLVATQAMEATIQKAASTGIAMTVVRNSNHFGAAGYYARMASRQGLIGIAMTNTNPITIPTHARVPFLGSNPIACAVPAESNDMVFDAATSTVSFGKIEILKRQQNRMPQQWALNERGEVSTSPNEIVTGLRQVPRVGGILPIGGSGEEHSGYKGYGISLMVEILTGVLAQGTLSADQQKAHQQGISHSFIVLNPTLFGNFEEIKGAVTDLLHRLRALPSSDGFPVLVPGDKENVAYHKNIQEGILVQESTLSEIQRISLEQGIK
jgi:LDH2 family malate/lactate/ureidoglycolate dehydrogenase